MLSARVKRIGLFLFLVILFLSQQAVEAAPELFPIRVSEAVRMALANSLDIQAERETIRLREAALMVAESRFDPSLSFHMDRKDLARGSTSFIETGLTGRDLLKQEERAMGLGWKRPLRWGGEYALTFTQWRTDATFQRMNPTYQEEISFTVTQPLLKGFGRKIAGGSLSLAQIDLEVTRQLFLARAMEKVQAIISLYWELMFQRRNFAVQQAALTWAKQLLELNRTRASLGLLAPMEVLVSEVSVASREEAVILAEQSRDDLEDQFRQMVGLPSEPEDHSRQILLSDQPIEEEQVLELSSLLQTAFLERQDVGAMELRLQQQTLSVQMAQNQLRPSLDLIGAFGPTGIGQNVSEALKQFSSGDFYQWKAGLLFNLPIGNRAALALLAEARAKESQAHIEKKKRMEQISLEVREGKRRVESDFERIKATRRALDLARKQQDAGEEQFRLGLLSSHALVDLQKEVALAEGNALRAMTDYNKSLTNLYRVTGRLLSVYSIDLEEILSLSGS